MKIGIIGLGYWGNILLKNLESMGEKNLELCDISLPESGTYNNYPSVNDYKRLKCDYVFITTPTITHFEICKYFLENKINVFCEKPLANTTAQAKTLYDIAISNHVILFTDWIFTFNSQIETIKRDYDSGKLGRIQSVVMNRLNLGPERFDVSARWDLASHDISIIQYLFSEFPKEIKWMDYKKNKKSKQEDSSLGLLKYKDFIVTVNVSWSYRKKVRECVFEFDNYFVVWDDYKRFLQYEDSTNLSFPIYSGNLTYPCGEYFPPLQKAITSFLNFTEEDMLRQKRITIETTKILEV